VLVAASLSGQTDTTQLPYPDGYRFWAHVKAAFIQEGGFIDNLHSDNTGSIGEPGKKPEERIKFPPIRIQ
jgi:hypothetical protein